MLELPTPEFTDKGTKAQKACVSNPEAAQLLVLAQDYNPS